MTDMGAGWASTRAGLGKVLGILSRLSRHEFRLTMSGGIVYSNCLSVSERSGVK